MLKQPTKLNMVAATLAALVLIGAQGALADGSYGDPAGDSGSAPDVTNVAISHDAAGLITLAIATNQQSLTPEMHFWGYIDTDLNAATGLPYRGIGAERFFLADADGGLVAEVVGNLILIDFDSELTASYANGTQTVQFPRSLLGSGETFAIALQSEHEDADGNTIAADYAPDGPPSYVYSFVEEALTLTMGKPAGAPAQPIAGKAFVVSAPLTRSDDQPFTDAEVTCQARVGKQALRPAGRLAGSSARCSMRIPKGSKGKVLRGSITVLADEVTVKKPFTFTVR